MEMTVAAKRCARLDIEAGDTPVSDLGAVAWQQISGVARCPWHSQEVARGPLALHHHHNRPPPPFHLACSVHSVVYDPSGKTLDPNVRTLLIVNGIRSA